VTVTVVVVAGEDDEIVPVTRNDDWPFEFWPVFSVEWERWNYLGAYTQLERDTFDLAVELENEAHRRARRQTMAALSADLSARRAVRSTPPAP